MTATFCGESLTEVDVGCFNREIRQRVLERIEAMGTIHGHRIGPTRIDEIDRVAGTATVVVHVKRTGVIGIEFFDEIENGIGR